MKTRIKDGDVVVVISGDHSGNIGVFNRVKNGIDIGFVCFAESTGSTLIDVYNGDCLIVPDSLLRVATKSEKSDFHKARRHFESRRKIKCEICHGDGYGDGTRVCFTCNGTGKVK